MGASPSVTRRFVCNAALLLLASGILKADIYVNCPGSTTGGSPTYPTIGAALAALSSIPNARVIQVAGTCSEIVSINSFRSIELKAAPGAVLLDPNPTGSGVPVLSVNGSDDVTITGLIIRGTGGRTDLVRVSASRVHFWNSTIEGSGGTGLFILAQGQTRVDGGSIVQNNEQGIRVGHGSTLDLGNNVIDPVATVVRRNGRGVRVDGNSLAHIAGATIIRDNTTFGVSVQGARVSMCCETDQRQIVNNGTYGLDLSLGSSISMWGGVLVEGNGSTGLRLTGGSSANVNGDGGAQVFRSNRGNGMTAALNSTLWVRSAEISGNSLRGIAVSYNSSVYLVTSSVRGSGQEGVSLSDVSSGLLGGLNTVTGNGAFDLFCGPDSMARGTRSEYGKIFCPAFNQSPAPQPGKPDLP